jgi:hypothetical protein
VLVLDELLDRLIAVLDELLDTLAAVLDELLLLECGRRLTTPAKPPVANS